MYLFKQRSMNIHSRIPQLPDRLQCFCWLTVVFRQSDSRKMLRELTARLAVGRNFHTSPRPGASIPADRVVPIPRDSLLTEEAPVKRCVTKLSERSLPPQAGGLLARPCLGLLWGKCRRLLWQEHQSQKVTVHSLDSSACDGLHCDFVWKNGWLQVDVKAFVYVTRTQPCYTKTCGTLFIDFKGTQQLLCIQHLFLLKPGKSSLILVKKRIPDSYLVPFTVPHPSGAQ